MNKIVYVCKYSSVCDWNCEKCKYLLKELQLVDLNKLPKETEYKDLTCDCT